MRDIKTPTMASIIPDRAGESVSLGKAYENAEQVNKNRQKVIVGALAIERQIDRLITIYLFDSRVREASFFEEWFTASSWFNFDAKRKVLLAIINLEQLFKDRKKDFENQLFEVIHIRNAFTHGDIIVEGNDKTYLCYFRNKRQKQELTDVYWANLEKVFFSVFHDIIALEGKLIELRQQRSVS